MATQARYLKNPRHTNAMTFEGVRQNVNFTTYHANGTIIERGKFTSQVFYGEDNRARIHVTLENGPKSVRLLEDMGIVRRRRNDTWREDRYTLPS